MNTDRSKHSGSRIGWVVAGGLALVLMIVLLSPKNQAVAPRPRAGISPQTLTGQNQGPQEQKWYSGGTLHKSMSSEWRRATPRNKLATAADWAISQFEKGSITPHQLKPYAEQLVECADGVASDPDIEVRMTDVAAMCWIRMYGSD